MMAMAPTLFTLFAVVIALYSHHVQAQDTNAVCMDSFAWATNSLQQSPCKVASYLLGQCASNSHVDALPEGSHYGGPTTVAESNGCQCSTVTFSLLSACGHCQNRTVEAWSVYSAHCSYVYIGEYPEELPSDTAVPGWAYLDVKAKDGFDLELAKQNANITESVRPKPVPATTPNTSPSPTPAESSSTPLPSASSIITADAPQRVVGYTAAQSRAIIGGICGGTAGAVFLILGAFYLRKRYLHRKRIEKNLHTLGSSETRSEMTKHANSSGSSVVKVEP